MYKLSQYNVVIKEKETNKLIFNSRTQALSWISSEIYDNLNNCTKEEQYRLKKLGFIVESNRDCKSQYKNVGIVQYKHVGKTTSLYWTF